MRDWLEVIILGIIEGITEFLPISSTGHLLLAEQWLGQRTEYFTVFIQCGAVMAVIAVFKNRVRELFETRSDKKTKDYLAKMGCSFTLTAIGGLALKKAGWELPEETAPVAWALLIGGVIFLLVDKEEKNNQQITQITWALAIAFGLAQLVAMIFPGASRSGTTILIGIILGMRREEAVEYSFLLGVPTLLAAGMYQLISAAREDHQAVIAEAPMLALGTAVSAITAFVVVKWLLAYLRTNTFNKFGWYRIILGTLILLFAT